MTKLNAETREPPSEQKISGYEIVQSLGRTAGSSLYRIRRAGDEGPALLKRLDGKSEPARADRFRAEHELLASLSVPGIPRPLTLVSDGSEPAMLIEDLEGDLLESFLTEPMSITRALRFGLQLAGSLGSLHDEHIIHRDLRPVNLLASRGDDRISIVDLSWAGAVDRSDAPVYDDLAYISPEQTGRTDSPVDARSDLYSLGVILYRMLGGRLPFVATDALEWMHCHLARAPVPLIQHVPELPGPISAIVSKLLAKDPRERYQSGRGVAADLARCLAEWESSKQVTDFALGSRDVADRIAIPNKLLGREPQLADLERAWERISSSDKTEMVLIAGYSGIGKTSLVNELRRHVLDAGGFFLTGKFDQRKRDIPYASFAQAFQALMQQLLGGSEAELVQWRQRLSDALGANGGLMTAVIPDLEHVIGQQPPVTELGAHEARNRFHVAFQKFLGVFATRAHPLVLFIDDLQWLDPASLTLLEYLGTPRDNQSLLFIGAYRDNEVTLAHPLHLTLDAIRRAGTRITPLVLGPISRTDVALLISRALHVSTDAAAQLAEVVHDKTGGNPFFATQFLLSLHEEGAITFDSSSGEFGWDMAEIRARSVTDNVVDLLLVKLRRLPPATQVAVAEMACLGIRVETAILAAAHGGTDEEVHASLAEAVQAGLIFRSERGYRFLHDRVQEAGYALLPPKERAGSHLRIARHLSAHLSQDQLVGRLFDLAGQWNRGAEQLTDASEIVSLIDLNATAGAKAKSSAAYATARAYYAAAVALLPQGAWSSRYDTALELHLSLAECECLIGAYDESAELLELTLGHARTAVDRARAYVLRIRVCQLAGNYREAVLAMLEGLRALGMPLPETAEEVTRAAQAELRGVTRLLDAQRTPSFAAPEAATAPGVRAMLDLLDEGDAATFVAHPQLWPLVVIRSVTVRLQYGETTHSAAAYVSAGLAIASVTGDMTRALAVSELAVTREYLARRDPSADAGKLIAKHAAMLTIWVRHFAASLPLLETAFSACVEVGDFLFIGYLTFNVVWLVFESGATLETVTAATLRWTGIARETHNDAMGEVVRGAARFIGRLRGIYDIGASPFDFDQAIAKLTAARFNVGVNFLLAMRQTAAFLEGRYERAWQHTEAMSAMLSAVRLLAVEATHHTFRGLTAAALYAEATGDRRRELLDAATDEVRRHARWRQHGPENFSTRHALLSAELARMEGRLLEAEHFYEEAIAAAREQNFIQYEALAWELASRFYRGRGLLTIADAHLREARHCYGAWGAVAKVKQLDRSHPQLQEARRDVATTGASSVHMGALDLLAVVKASQAISQQIVQDDLIATLMQVVLESAGAETGALLLPRDAALTVAARASVDGSRLVVRKVDELASPAELPLSVLNYVRRTKERVLLTDVSRANAFSGDEAFLRRTPKSLLCLPIVLQTELVGLLYLENGTFANGFPPDRVEMLTLLAGQAAISLQHARLYGDLRRENLERRQAEAALRDSQDLLRGIVDNSRALIYVKDAEGRFLLVNRHLAEVLGRDREALLGKTDFDLFPSEQAAAYRAVDSRVLTEGIPVEVEEAGRTPDGPRTYLSVKAPLFDPNGKTYALCGISTDITERKRTEETLRQKEQQLRQAQKMEAIGNLAGGVAHDFNNLLTVILGSSQLLALQIEPGHPSEADLRAIEEAGQRAVTLTRQLLAFSRKQILKPQVVDLNQIVARLELMLRRLIGEDIELTFKAGASLGSVLVDPGQAEQILMNLAVNARDAMPAGGRLTIETDNVAMGEVDASRPIGAVPGPHVMLSVSDTGIGMDALTQSRIFEPFFTTKGPGKGTGLGLSTVLGIVQQSGGTLEVKSALGEGTTFQIYLPQTSRPSHSPAKSAPIDDGRSLKGWETILLVEDDSLVRALTRTLLSEAGYHVLEAESAEAGLALAEPESVTIHLLLTDVVMPRMGGRQLADQVCARHHETKVLFMSGYTNDSIIHHGIVESAVELLEKPFTRVALLHRVRDLLDAPNG
jgi:PAS domain S-box-containing protein